VLRAKVDEEVMEGNILLKLRENFEDKFRYDASGVPRIWRPTDDIEGLYTAARASTLTLIPLLERFQSSRTTEPPPLDTWIGPPPSAVTAADEEDLAPIGGVDEDEGKSLEEEMRVLSEAKRQDLTARFKKAADGVYVEAKRSAIGGVAQVPLYFYGLLLALGWNEIVAGNVNPTLSLPDSVVLCVPESIADTHGTRDSPPQPTLLRLPHPPSCRRLRDVHAQPVGPDTAHDQRRDAAGAGGRQGAAA
jgi:hypothetical protein